VIFDRTEIDGIVVVTPERLEDERGFFARIGAPEEFAREGLATDFLYSSISYNPRAGTLRGMHYQMGPHDEDKLVRCTRGNVFDVAVDLRPNSATRYKWIGVELTAENHLALYIPAGCAHGFVTLAPATELLYMISAPYAPEAATGVRWDDPAIGIGWPEVGPLTMSDRDRTWPLLETSEAVD
jgi:dTDP-4-dehydrorhamnose 3,5-epimerase